jgi:hypothetical protein
MMKTLFAVAVLCVFATSALADQSVRGYQRSSPNSTVTVRGYHRSSPDGTVINNYSFKGNVNPDTGKVGTNYYPHDKTSPYYVGPASGHDSSRN